MSRHDAAVKLREERIRDAAHLSIVVREGAFGDLRIERAVDAGPNTSGTWRRHHNVKVSVARRSSGTVRGRRGVGLVGRM